ncbi:MAG: NAD+ synthase [Armatimonadetes bacterium]|nr:NAD+ synthase [Armatimonadota bacterium]
MGENWVVIPICRSERRNLLDPSVLQLNNKLLRDWLVAFLKDEVIRQRGISKVVLGLSGGVDSAVVAYLAAEAFGPKNVYAIRLPYAISSPESLTHAELVVNDTGINCETIEITAMVDGYRLLADPEMSGQRIGNICARCRMTILFDQAMKVGGLPLGTGNKTERLFGYYTWHADDAPPINPLGDLFKSQVWPLARELGVPAPIVDKPPTADLIKGQTDEGDFGLKYEEADSILNLIIRGFTRERLLAMGVLEHSLNLVEKRLDGTHWKRRLPTVAMVSDTAIGEYYLRPVDYR